MLKREKMEYQELVERFEKNEKVFYQKKENEKWKRDSSKEELCPIHNFIYKINP